jgi:hypothetical protein
MREITDFSSTLKGPKVDYRSNHVPTRRRTIIPYLNGTKGQIFHGKGTDITSDGPNPDIWKQRSIRRPDFLSAIKV